MKSRGKSREVKWIDGQAREVVHDNFKFPYLIEIFFSDSQSGLARAVPRAPGQQGAQGVDLQADARGEEGRGARQGVVPRGKYF